VSWVYSDGDRGFGQIEDRRAARDQRDERRRTCTARAARVSSPGGGVALDVVDLEMYVTQIPQAPRRILFKASLQQQTDAGGCFARQGVPLRLAPKDGRDGV